MIQLPFTKQYTGRSRESKFDDIRYARTLDILPEVGKRVRGRVLVLILVHQPLLLCEIPSSVCVVIRPIRTFLCRRI